MVTEAEARKIAERALNLDIFVIVGMQEYDVGWLYFYDSKRHLETGALEDALAGNAPILVDRSDGATHFTGTARSQDEYIERYRRRLTSDDWLHP